VSALFTQCLGDTVQTGTGKVDLAGKFKCTTAARGAGSFELQGKERAYSQLLRASASQLL